MNVKQITKRNKGITLIALIITIIVLLLLAGITVSFFLNEDGIVANAKRAELDHRIGEVKESVFLHGMATAEWSFEKTETTGRAASSTASDVSEIKLLQNNFEGFKEYDITRIKTLLNTITTTEDNPYEGINKGQRFFIVDMSPLNRIMDIGSKKNGEDDVFIMCENTKNVYYAKGIKISSKEVYHGRRVGNTMDDNGIVDFPITEPGVYRVTANAGQKAIWLNVLLEGLVVPEGAKIQLQYEASDDRSVWDAPVYKIEEARQSQYLKVTLTLIANEKGESPSIQYMKIKFKPVSEYSETEKPDKTVSDNIIETENGLGLDPSSPEPGKVTQIVTLPEEKVIDSVYAPIIKDGIAIGEISSSDSGSGSIIYVSKDGTNWIPFVPGDDTPYKHVKVETTIKEPGIFIGDVVVNVKDAIIVAERDTWITTKTDYYYFDALEVGHWISIETDEYKPRGTRIRYSFSKSNDDIKWTGYNEAITANGDSRYILVKIEYQKENEKITSMPKLNDLVINYTINGVNKSTSMKDKGLNVVAQDIDGGRWQIIAINLSKEIVSIDYKKSTDSTFKREDGNRVDIVDNATYIVKVNYSDNTSSEEVTVVVKDIKPIAINVAYSAEYFTQDNVVMTVTANGVGGIKELKYEKGQWNTDYFKYNGKSLLENNTITVTENNSTYTLYALDNEGNMKIRVVTINNIMPPLEDKGALTTDKGISEFIRDTDLANGKYTLTIKEETYPIQVYNYYNDMQYNGVSYVGDNSDDDGMLIMKYHKNLKVSSGATLTPYARKKGFYVCTLGTITNNGEISMTARGASAAGQNVYLYKNGADSYEFVPATGASGGVAIGGEFSLDIPGLSRPGANGSGRSTGGGGSGGRWTYPNAAWNRAGTGGKGTSYSGGSGGGSVANGGYGGDASSTGGAGGAGTAPGGGGRSAGGTGNPGGNGGYYGTGNDTTYKGNSGTGGLLILYANDLSNAGKITANGVTGRIGEYTASGGASGGGSINIFYRNTITQGSISAAGGVRAGTAGAGGNGTVSITKVNN